MKIISIAYNTFRESVRDRVLYSLVFFVLVLIIASVIIGKIAVGQEAKFVVDVGLSAMTLFGLVIVVFIGIGLVSRRSKNRPSSRSFPNLSGARPSFSANISAYALLSWSMS